MTRWRHELLEARHRRARDVIGIGPTPTPVTACAKIMTGMDRLHIAGSARGWVLVGEIDAANCDELSTAMAVLPHVTAGPIEVDFAGVTFMDSVGLRVLVDLYQRVTAAGGTVVITNPPQGVVRLLRITDLTSQFGVSYHDVWPPHEGAVDSDAE